MAVSKKSSPVGLILLLIFFFVAGVIIAFTSGAAQKFQQSRSNADVAPIALSFSTGAVQNGVTPLTLNATSAIGVGFAEIDLTFDKTKLQLAGEMTKSSVLTFIDSKTSMANANSTGTIQILLGLDPNNSASPGMGTFDLVTIPFKSATATQQTAAVTVDTAKTYFVDLASNNLGYNGISYTFGSPTTVPSTNPTVTTAATNTPTRAATATPTKSPTPTLTRTPTPRVTVTATLTPRVTATPTGSVVCWNRVTSNNGQLYWPNGCKGTPNADICTQVVVPLTSSEITQYDAWVSAGSPMYQGCGTVSPTTKPSNTPSPTIRPSNTPTTMTRPTSTPVAGNSPTPTMTSGTPTPTPVIIPNPPAWWFVIPEPLRNFLEQLYVWVFFFRQSSTQSNLLEGLPTPTP